MNKKIIILALLSNACTLWAQGPFDSIKLIIPLRDTVHSTFSQSSIPFDCQYTDTSAMYFVDNTLKIEAQSINGQWINIENPRTLSEDGLIGAYDFEGKICINFLYLFWLDSMTFNACDGNGCEINIRVSLVFATDNTYSTIKNRIFAAFPCLNQRRTNGSNFFF
jgi:hypothetical protein